MWTIAYMLIFSCVFNPRCPWAQLFALWFSFLSEAMENKLGSEVFGKLYVAEVVGRRKLSFFPLRNFCIQFVSFQAKQMGIIFIAFSLYFRKVLSFNEFNTYHRLIGKDSWNSVSKGNDCTKPSILLKMLNDQHGSNGDSK